MTAQPEREMSASACTPSMPGCNCHNENKGLHKAVTYSVKVAISVTVLGKYTPLIGGYIMAYRVAPCSVTLSDPQDHSPIASLCEYDFLYIRTAHDNISSDIERRMVLSFQVNLLYAVVPC